MHFRSYLILQSKMALNDQVQLLSRSSFLSETTVRRNNQNEAMFAYQLYEIISHFRQQPLIQILSSSEQKDNNANQHQKDLIFHKSEIEKSQNQDEVNTRRNSFKYESQQDHILKYDQHDSEVNKQKEDQSLGIKLLKTPQKQEKAETMLAQNYENSSGQHGDQNQAGRKRRQTITADILTRINHLFQNYESHLEGRQADSLNSQPYCQTLKEISALLNVSISAIRRKYREYKTNNKQVKEGILIKFKNQKRLYKKSIKRKRDFEEFIEKNDFKSMKEMKESYLQEYGNQISKAKLNSYLIKFGIAKSRLEKNSLFSNKKQSMENEKTKERRKQYLEKMFELLNKSNRKLFYIGECQFSTLDFKGTQLRLQERYTAQDSNCLFTAIAFVSFMDGIIHYQIVRGKSSNFQYRTFLHKVQNQLRNMQIQTPKVISISNIHKFSPFWVTDIKQKMENIYFAEIPFFSQQLNFSNYILTKIKDRIANDIDKTTEQRQERLEMFLSSYINVSMYNETDEIKKAVELAAGGKNFMTD